MLKPYMVHGRIDVLQTLKKLIEARDNKQPLSLIRLGDGEGRLLGYPDIITKSELDKSLKIWFGQITFDVKDLIVVSKQLRTSVRTADIIGIPRQKQQQRHEYQSVIYAIKRFNLIQKKQLITDSAIHRYLQFGLFYRNFLGNINYCGLITCRNIADKIQKIFNIEKVEQYLIPGETLYPGEYKDKHFPNRFYELRKNLNVPFRGAIFLVGAGALGKIYCQWIKEFGGIAVDIGSLFDAWAKVESRLKNPCHSIDEYNKITSIPLAEAIERYNKLCDNFGIDSARLYISSSSRNLHIYNKI